MEPLVVGLLGVGNVGSGVVRLLQEQGERIARRAGRRIALTRALVRDSRRSRPVEIAPELLTTDPRQVLDDPEIQVVIELIGGTEPARSFILDALAAGKDVVTANKALLADHGPELFDQARRFQRAIAFEAAVAGGIPIVNALGVGLTANQTQALAAILNGTSNFILTKMTREGIAYESALRQAQERGYAEADPTLDVNGTDTAHKLAILAQLAFGATVHTAHISRVGIDRLDVDDIRYAGELGYTIKLLALARLLPEALELRVAPTLVKHGTPLADVSEAYNAIRVIGDAVGDTLFYGRGAGMMPTASAVVGDLIDVVVGRAALTAKALNLWPVDDAPARLATPEQVQSRYYLRFNIADRPGVLGLIAQVLGRHGVSIASVIQHEPSDDDGPGAPVPLVFMTHTAIEANLAAAVSEIDHLDVVAPPSVCLGVED